MKSFLTMLWQRSIAVIAAVALALVPMAGMISTTGCSAAQVMAAVADVQSKLPQVAEIAQGILLEVSPADAALVQPITAGLQTVSGDLVDLIKAYQQNPNASTLDKINALYQEGLGYVGQLAQVKGLSPKAVGLATATAGLLGIIFNDVSSWAASQAPKAALDRLPAFFGWHIAGVNLVAIDGSKLPPPSKSAPKHSGYSSRDIAKAFNKLVKNDKAKIHVNRYHLLGVVPVPGTGHK